MKNKRIITLLSSFFLLISCSTPANPSSDTSSKGDETSGSTSQEKTSSSEETSLPEYSSEDVEKYMQNLRKNSENGHLYVHYLGFKPSADYYNDYDVWAWPYRPKTGEGYRFDWNGRTTDVDRKTASGNATIDELGYATADIDLTKDNYDGGWDYIARSMGGQNTNFYQNDGTTLDEQVGIQIVESKSRIEGKGFWNSDGGNLYVKLEDYALSTEKGGTSYHVFLIQEHVQTPSTTPPTSDEIIDPFDGDVGEKVTYGNDAYNNADWNDKPLQATSSKFLNGDKESGILPNGAGVGYQIMVSSFADSDGDGNGDIYGIEQKLDYLQNLGVNVLWLTPIQLSDSYHGYDIADYLTVDPKFGSSVSPASAAAGKVDSSTAMADYKSLIDAAHDRGMAVIMDLVLNHTSTTNKWFINSAQLNETYRGYYQWGNHDTQEQIKEENYWYPYGSHHYSYYAKFSSSMPELNYAYASTREAVADMAKTWCAFGVDGFRMDAVKHIFLKDEVSVDSQDTIINDVSAAGDYSSDLTKNLNFWRQLNYDVKSEYPNAFFVGENFDGAAYYVAPYYEGFDSLFDFYSYFNLTSIAATVKNDSSAKAANYEGWLPSFLGAWDSSTPASDRWGAQKDKDAGSITGSTKSLKYDGNWNINSVMQANNKYRSGSSSSSDSKGFDFINGAFTSNHDIARAINRVAGNTWKNTGLDAQGDVSIEEYDYLNRLSTVYEITELMLPGCTWIYYGDELGMTGNLNGKKSTDSYADLTYRQPMKWVDNGVVGDGSMTAGYSITGSGTSVSWDSTNASSKVVPANTQMNQDGSHYKNLASFAKIKSATPALIKGNYKADPISVSGNSARYGAIITRTLGSSVYKYYVNFGNDTLPISATGNILASFGGASLSSLPAQSALLVEVSGGVTPDPVEGEVTYNITGNDWMYNNGVDIYAWVWGDSMTDKWVKCTYVDATHCTLTVDAKYTGAKFIRVTSGVSPSWEAAHNQTGDCVLNNNNLNMTISFN